MTNRRTLLAGLAALMLTACAQSGPVDSTGRPLEELIFVTSTGEHKFMVEIADEEPERQRGMMFRPPLEDDRGMLFQFPDVADRSFWMHNTPSSLDIIYVGQDGKIVSIAANAQPYSDTSLPSNGPATGVVEIRGGRAAEIGARAGDTVRHTFFRSGG
jgi:uncharacterized membrane protein (UPF0127 family)